MLIPTKIPPSWSWVCVYGGRGRGQGGEGGRLVGSGDSEIPPGISVF